MPIMNGRRGTVARYATVGAGRQRVGVADPRRRSRPGACISRPIAANLCEMLDERSAAMLDFERAWWNNDEPRDQVIRARFQCSPEEYHAELTKVLDDPAAMDHDPLVVRRLKRLRLRARKARLDASSAAGEGAHA
jgi:hypothetical protein